MGELLEDMIKAFKEISDQPAVANEVYVSPPDHQHMMKMAADPAYRSLTFSGIVVHIDVDLERSHFVAVMSDNTIEVRGASAQKVALKVMAARVNRAMKLKVK